MAAAAGFDLERAASCLFSPPGEQLNDARREGIVQDAGFVAMRFAKAKLSGSSKGIR